MELDADVCVVGAGIAGLTAALRLVQAGLTVVGRVHWAGTETATVTHGGIDGAIRSGERAACEVIEAEERSTHRPHERGSG